jgi:hypothetical protein
MWPAADTATAYGWPTDDVSSVARGVNVAPPFPASVVTNAPDALVKYARRRYPVKSAITMLPSTGWCARATGPFSLAVAAGPSA